MRFYDATKSALDAAYEECGYGFAWVGRIQGEWQVALADDLGRQAEMDRASRMVVGMDGLELGGLTDTIAEIVDEDLGDGRYAMDGSIVTVWPTGVTVSDWRFNDTASEAYRRR